MRRNRKKKPVSKAPVRCIVFLSTDENNDFELAEKKENKQLRYINEYAKANNLVPMKIIRKGCFEGYIRNNLFLKAISLMEQGKAEALLVANMAAISSGIADAYLRVGMVKERGFRVFTVDEGELEMNLYQLPAKTELEV